MLATPECLLQMIYACFDELNEQFGVVTRKSPDQPLLGSQGGLDSLGVVNFVSLLEQKLQDEFGLQLVIWQEVFAPTDSSSVEKVGELANALADRIHASSMELDDLESR